MNVLGHDVGLDAALYYRRVARGVVHASNTRGSCAETDEPIDFLLLPMIHRIGSVADLYINLYSPKIR